MRALIYAVVAAFLFSSFSPRVDAADIDWQHWEIDAFETAKAENKIILVSVGMEGCAACQRMESLTYTDDTVIDLVNRHFMPIEVDAEARPGHRRAILRLGLAGHYFHDAGRHASSCHPR